MKENKEDNLLIVTRRNIIAKKIFEKFETRENLFNKLDALQLEEGKLRNEISKISKEISPLVKENVELEDKIKKSIKVNLCELYKEMIKLDGGDPEAEFSSFKIDLMCDKRMFVGNYTKDEILENVFGKNNEKSVFLIAEEKEVNDAFKIKVNPKTKVLTKAGWKPLFSQLRVVHNVDAVGKDTTYLKIQNKIFDIEFFIDDCEMDLYTFINDELKESAYFRIVKKKTFDKIKDEKVINLF